MRTAIFQAVVFVTLANLPLITYAEGPTWLRGKTVSPIRSSSPFRALNRENPTRESSGTPMDECPAELVAELLAADPSTTKTPSRSDESTVTHATHLETFTRKEAFVQKKSNAVSASFVGDSEESGSGLPQPIIAPVQHTQTSNTVVCDSIDTSNGSNCPSSEDCPSSQSDPLMVFETGPIGFSYYFRPYQYSDVARQQAEPLTRDRKNPYDNRFFEAIYSR